MESLGIKSEAAGGNARLAKNGERGFTLIETSIAMIVMMVAGLGAAALFTYAIKINNVSGAHAMSLAIAQQRLEQLRGVPFTDASLDSGTTTSTVAGVDSSYTVQTTIGGSTTLKDITIRVTPVRGDGLGQSSPIVVRTQRASPTVGPYLQ
jgi:Tfp pilus assembly protein PilV